MSTDRVGPLEGNADGHTVTVVVVCGFIGCDWSMEIGTAALEAHEAYIEHLDVHDPDHIAAEPDCEATEPPPIHPDRYIGQQAAFLAEYQAPSQAEMDAGGFRCPQCQRVSHHPEDVRQGYCGACHQFTGSTLYAGDSPEQLAADQARFDRFMAGGNDA